jgi:hypothetical protein
MGKAQSLEGFSLKVRVPAFCHLSNLLSKISQFIAQFGWVVHNKGALQTGQKMRNPVQVSNGALHQHSIGRLL